MDEVAAGGGNATGGTAAVAEELRQLMGLRSRRSVRDRSFPALFELLDPADLEPRDRRYAALTRLIDDAVTRIGDPAHAAAAAALLGSGPDRWRTVSQRGSDAAAHFGCGWDAYRRRRTNGTSQLDDTVDALGATLTAADGPADNITDQRGDEGRASPASPAIPAITASRPAVPVVPVAIGGATDPAGTTSAGDPGNDRDSNEDPDVSAGSAAGAAHTGRARRVVVGVGLVAAVLALALVAAAAVLDHEDDPAALQNPACDALDQRIGEVPDLADADIEAWAERFRELGRTLPPAAATCAGRIERAHGVVAQPVGDPDGTGVGAIVSTGTGSKQPLHLNDREYHLYRDVVDKFGTEMAGVPVRRDDRSDGTRVVRLTRGALVAAAPPVTFIVTGRAWLEWTQRGGLEGEMGAPVSNFRDIAGTGRVQDFEHGRLVIDHRDSTDVRWEPIENPAAMLPSEVSGTLLVSQDGTAWLVDRERVRHWLPNATDVGCTGNLDDEDVVREVPAQAIATLTPGDPIRCR